MKILYFSRDYSPHDHRILSAILNGGHEVFYLRLEDSGRNLESRSLPEGVQFVSWNKKRGKYHWWNLPDLVLDFKRILVDVQPDLVHAGPIQTVGFIAALSGFHPLVSMSWGFDLMLHAGQSTWNRWVTRNVLGKSDWLFGDCHAVLNKASEFGYDLSHSTYFPWGVDLTHFHPGEDQKIPHDLGWKDAFIVFSNRSWEPQYGVDTVARAFTKASAANPNLRLLLLGSGSQGELIQSILREGGALERVHMPGQIPLDRLADYYRAADLYISASHTDGSSVSLMEALACGIPAAVSDIAGNLEWVTPGEQGWIFQVNDADGLADIMQQACQSRVELAVMSLKARYKAEINANWKINQQRMLDGYKKATQAKE
jgi:glycosyltransferase involved in cell wall biosynthesis